MKVFEEFWTSCNLDIEFGSQHLQSQKMVR